MKKRLLTTIMGLGFLLLGTSVSKAEFPINNPIAEENVSQMRKNVSQMRKINIRFDETLLGVNCHQPRDACSNALAFATSMLLLAEATCEAKGWGSSECTAAQTAAFLAVINAAAICDESPEGPPVSFNWTEKEPIFPKVEKSGIELRNTSD